MPWVSGTKGRAFESPIAHQLFLRGQAISLAPYLRSHQGKRRTANRTST